MSAILPHGLINITSAEITNTPSTDHADVRFEREHVLHMFWKVHAVRHRVSRHISDERSRNLFWRTWSNPTLSQSVSTAALTHLWDQCRSDVDVSPFHLIVKSKARASEKDTTKPISPIASASQATHIGDLISPRDIHALPSQASITTSGSSDQQDLQSSTPSIRVSPSQNRDFHAFDSFNGVTQDNALPHRPKQARNSSSKNLLGRLTGGRDRGGARGRGRPFLGRRKSSQGPPQSVKSPKLSTLDDGNVQQDEEIVSAQPPVTKALAFELPSASSWEDELSTESSRQLSPQQSPKGSELRVDPDFRNKFAERIASTTNLASMNKFNKTGSVVRFADEVPLDLRQAGETGPLATTFEDDVRPKLLHRPSTSSVAVSDGEEDDDDAYPKPPIQRTTSSLSALLRSKAVQSNYNSIDTEQHSSEKNHKTGKHKEKLEEEELLAMGRRDGVTKAGGIQVPRQHRLSEVFDSRYSSPEPDPIF